MDSYCYPNLTIADDSDLRNIDPDALDNALRARVPPLAIDAVGHENIRDAVQQQFQVNIDIEDISKYGVELLTTSYKYIHHIQVLAYFAEALSMFLPTH